MAHPPEGIDRYRGADHMRCTHPTPPPAGYRRCVGDSGCEILLPTRSVNTVCGWHLDMWAGLPSSTWNVEELMNR